MPSQPSVPPVSGVLAEQPPLVSIRAPALPGLLEPTYAYLAAYCDACLPAPAAQRLSVAIYELCANALLHGLPTAEVRLQLATTAGGVRFLVENHADPAQRERLQAQLQCVGADPAAAFEREMNGFERGSGPAPMLGLVRVVHECGLKLELAIDGARVSVSTSCAI